MSFQLKISPRAQQDIDGIYDYIYQDSPKNAKEQIALIYKALENIETFPDMGAKLKGFVSVETDYNFFIANKLYAIFYLVNGDEILVSRIFKTEQDYLSHLGIK